jgi:hypothetical protein
LKVNDENRWIQIRIRIRRSGSVTKMSWIRNTASYDTQQYLPCLHCLAMPRIPGSDPVPKCHGSATLLPIHNNICFACTASQCRVSADPDVPKCHGFATLLPIHNNISLACTASQCRVSADPDLDPCKNVMDPHHCYPYKQYLTCLQCLAMPRRGGAGRWPPGPGWRPTGHRGRRPAGGPTGGPAPENQCSQLFPKIFQPDHKKIGHRQKRFRNVPSLV